MSNTDQLANELKNETTLFLENPSNDCWCPRCGEELLDGEPILNSTSRHVEGVLICTKCGVEEGELFLLGQTIRLEDWAYLS